VAISMRNMRLLRPCKQHFITTHAISCGSMQPQPLRSLCTIRAAVDAMPSSGTMQTSMGHAKAAYDVHAVACKAAVRMVDRAMQPVQRCHDRAALWKPHAGGLLYLSSSSAILRRAQVSSPCTLAAELHPSASFSTQILSDQWSNNEVVDGVQMLRYLLAACIGIHRTCIGHMAACTACPRRKGTTKVEVSDATACPRGSDTGTW
jgi:hypothetical protein